MKNLVSIIVVNHNSRESLYKCLSSLFSQRCVTIEVIVIDNASKDGSVEYIRSVFPEVTLLPQTRRRGFSANVNIGIRKSSGQYLLILNPDTQLQDDAIVMLVKRLKSNKKIGICGPKLLNTDGTIQMSFRKFPSWKTAILRRTPIRVLFRNSSVIKDHMCCDYDHGSALKVDWILGACLLVRRELIEDIGPFDEFYRLYVEDIDFCLRANRSGWQVWYEPRAVVIHAHNAVSDKQLLSIHSTYHFLSMMRFIIKFWAKDHVLNYGRFLRRIVSKTCFYLRAMHYSLFLEIKKAICPICKWQGNKFRDYDCGYGRIYKNAECPLCLSHPRHRLVYLYLKKILLPYKNIRILHFAPEESLENFFLKIGQIEYLSADLEPVRAMRKENIERLSFQNDFFDLIICLCVLEHVTDDVSALNEVFRVLKPGGICVFDTPIDYNNAKTLEGLTFSNPKERAKYYWQDDHVRLYGRDFPKRLSNIGFNVVSLRSSDFGDKKFILQNGLPNYPIYIGQKL